MKLQTSPSFIKRNASFMKMLTKIDLNIDPWGTPRTISSDRLTRFLPFDRKFWFNLRLVSLNPDIASYANLVKISSWFTQLYPLKKSISKVPTTSSDSSRHLCHFWSKLTNMYWVLYFPLKPRKRMKRNLIESFVSWSNNTLSNILEIVGSTLTGL